MVDKFEADNDEFQVIRSDKIAFDTNNPSFSLFDTGRIQTTVNVVFPDMLSNLLYFNNSQGSPAGTTYCESWSSLLPQEWGPDETDFSPTGAVTTSIRRNLPRTILGTVPTGTNHLNIRVRLRRTKAAPSFYNQGSPTLFFPNNQWITLAGGSCTCEGMGTSIKRHFDVVLSGTTLYIERYQSVNNLGTQFSTSSSGNARGWITNRESDGALMGAYDNAPFGMGFPMVLLETKGPNADGTKFPPWGANASNSCSISANADYESIYNVDFDIQPGRYL